MDYEKEKQNQEAALHNELDALKCEFENLREELKITKEKNEFLQTKLTHANSEISFLKGQIEAYQYIVNCRR